MSTIFTNVYAINGVISTDKTVLQNLTNLTTASGCWLTYDTAAGKWSVIINKTDSSVANFNDSNIVGGITISESGINELYNSVTVEFPHATLRDQTDFIRVEIDPQLRYPNEIDNNLSMQIDCINNPVQAQLLANVELKQSRVSKVIQFRTDFSKIGLKAGDLITVTNTMYNFSSKIFRVTKVEEDDSDGLVLSITALEYSEDVYTPQGINYTNRKKNTGILIQEQNDVIKDLDDQDWTASLMRMLGATAATGLFNLLLTRNPLTGKVIQALNPKAGVSDQLITSLATPIVTITGPSEACEGSTLQLTVTMCVSSCAAANGIQLPYTITGITSADTSFPLTGNVTVNSAGTATMNIPITLDSETDNNETMVVTVGGASKSIALKDKLGFTYVTDASPSSITAGGSSTVTLTTTNVADGTVIPYTITGGGFASVSTPLTGTVTVNSNTATLTVDTITNSTYQGTKTVTVTFDASRADACSELDKTAIISIGDNITAPPSDTNCEFVTVPLVWCGTYDGTTGELKSMTATKSVTLPKARSGESSVNVPTAVTVTPGSPSTIAVTSTAAVLSSSSVGGAAVQVITSFNSVAVNKSITGTTQTFYGYFS